MREIWVTKFVCAKCGANLSLAEAPPRGAGSFVYGEPTGSDMVQTLVAIEPCQQCFAPLELMRDAARTLLGT